MDKKPDLREVLEEYGVEITNRDAFNTLCPFHEESRPSFSVDLSQGLWFCFHDYTGGDAIDFVGAMTFGLHAWNASDKAMFKEVLDILEKKNFTRKEIKPRKKEKKELSQNVLFLLGHVTQIYHQNLLQEPDVLSYLQGRGITESFIRSRKLGYANGNLGVMLSMLPQDVYRKLAVKAGLIYVSRKGGEERRWEFMKGQITFPDLDRDGRVLGIIGRRKDPRQNPKYLTLNGLPKVMWGLGRFSQWQPVIIHESIMDACTALLMGVPSASPCGTGIAWHLVEELKKRKCLGFLSQDDPPSKRAIQRWKEKLPHGRPIEGDYDGCKDLNQMATEMGWEPARARLYELLAQGGFEYEFGNQHEI